jgi:putative membrane protein (TIGR04086 family)
MSNTGTSKRQRSGTKLSFAILKALFFTLLLTVVLVFLASLAIVRHPDPLPLIPYVGMGILAVAALLCGYFTAKFTKGSFPIGMFGGAILAALLFAAAVVFGALGPLPFSLLPYPIAILLSGVGGLLGKKRRARRRRH